MDVHIGCVESIQDMLDMLSPLHIFLEVSIELQHQK